VLLRIQVHQRRHLHRLSPSHLIWNFLRLILNQWALNQRLDPGLGGLGYPRCIPFDRARCWFLPDVLPQDWKGHSSRMRRSSSRNSFDSQLDGWLLDPLLGHHNRVHCCCSGGHYLAWQAFSDYHYIFHWSLLLSERHQFLRRRLPFRVHSTVRNRQWTSNLGHFPQNLLRLPRWHGSVKHCRHLHSV